MKALVNTVQWTTLCLLAAACGDSAGSGGSIGSASDGGSSTSRGTSSTDATMPTEGGGSTSDSATVGTDGGGSNSDSQASTPDTSSDSSPTMTTSDSETSADDTTAGPAPFCGDGAVDADEQCDDGADNGPGQACNSECSPNVCGDGDQGPGEACDNGPENADEQLCKSDCTLASCGDGIAQPGEGCDDGNQNDIDACANSCVPASCGDGIVQILEACDDGNKMDTDSCLGTCALAVCGDGSVQAGVEACDDGNQVVDDDCTNACKLPACDDAIKNGGETDLDCGGSLCAACGQGQGCGNESDCEDGLLCTASVCTYPVSCKAIKEANPAAPSGFHTIDLDADGPEAPLEVYCEQTYLGGGWMRLMSAKYPHIFKDGDWQNLNAGTPKAENYSILGKRDLLKNGQNYTFRYAIGNTMTWQDGPVLFQIAWTQGHDPFTKTTAGADYTYLGGDKPTTCGGFNGLHNKYTIPSYATDVDANDGVGCWWMQVAPRQIIPPPYPPGYLHGFLGGGNLDPKNVTQWQVLYMR